MSVRAVVECKQYQKNKRKTFAETLTDYARACPNARLALVSYGPTSDEILDLVPAPERPRCAVIERLRPDDAAARKRFADWLREVLGFTAHDNRLEESPADCWATIRLDWSDRPRDLDLHAVIHEATAAVVSYPRPHTRRTASRRPGSRCDRWPRPRDDQDLSPRRPG
jgi:hypothetical protein